MMGRFTLWIGTVCELGAYQWRTWRQTWAIRRELDGSPYRREEATFLASAIALEKSPASPAPRVTMWLLIVFSVIAVLWAAFGQIDIVATAPGKIIVNGHSKTIQSLETASVKSILVHEGDSVRAGDVLLELDTAAPEADVMRLQGDLRAARLKADRARALLSAQQSGVLPVLQARATLTSASPTTAESASQRQAQGMFIEYQARLERIDADIARRRAELTSGEELANKLEQTLPLARSRAQNLKELSEPGYVSRHTWMDKEQQKIEMEGDLNTQRSRIKETQAGLREAQAQRAMVAAEMRRQMLDQLSEGEQQAQAIGQELSKAQSRQRLMQVRAPIDGTVQQLAVNTIGGVVTPAQALMLLVPNQLRLEVDARLDNKDIGFVKAGQTVEVKIDTFPYTRYGVLRATVLHVSHDAVGDEKQGLTYLARIQLEQSQIQVDEKMVPLVPGMAVAAEIKTGRRRVLDYFLSPLLQYQHESFRER